MLAFRSPARNLSIRRSPSADSGRAPVFVSARNAASPAATGASAIASSEVSTATGEIAEAWAPAAGVADVLADGTVTRAGDARSGVDAASMRAVRNHSQVPMTTAKIAPMTIIAVDVERSAMRLIPVGHRQPSATAPVPA